MRLIFLSWAYPPMRYPRAVQVARLATHLGRPVEVFCAAVDGDHGTGAAVTRVPNPPLQQWLDRITTPKLRAALVAPDPQRFWAGAAARTIAATAPDARDLLVTFGQPMSDHLAGLALKRRFGMRWIAHFSDPWADNPLAPPVPMLKARNLALERRVVAAADRLLVTSAETQTLMTQKYPPAIRAKAVVLPHAFDAARFPPRTRASGPLLLRYLGTFYSHRGPRPLIDGLAALAARQPDLAVRLRVEIIGDISPRLQSDDAAQSLPPGLLHFRPAVDYPTSLALMREADLLLHIDAPAASSVFFASKLADYLGARRPILAITPPGTAAQLVRALGGWVADPADPGVVAAALAEALAYLAAHREHDWGDETVRCRYDIATVNGDFSRLVDEAAGCRA